MGSFSMNRYLGDDYKPKKSITLDEINRQAKERKEQRDLKSNKHGPSTSAVTEKKKKKRKIQNECEDNHEEQALNRDKISADEVPNKMKKTENTELKVGNKKSNKKRLKKKKRKAKNKLLEDANNGLEEGDDKNFTLIGEELDNKNQKVKRVLPDWLSNPDVISSDLHSKLTAIDAIPGLNQSIVSLLENNGITHFFPVQSKIIPWLLQNSNRSVYRPRDLCVSSPTGSGKTLAYALPIIQAIRERVICNIKAIVVLPVRDLATQVYKVFQTFCENTGLKVGLAIGQISFPVEQASLIRKGYRKYHSLVDILVCTPGRLVDHINETPGFSLQDLRFLVIDEADRMMQHIKQGWLSHVEKCIYGQEGKDNIPLVVSRLSQLRNMPQKLLFSATLSHNPEQLQQMKLFQPKLFTAVVHSDNSLNGRLDEEYVGISEDYIGKYTTPQELTEHYISCATPIKPLILLFLIHHLKYRYLLVFTNTVESTHRLCLLLKSYGGINVKELSSNLHIRRREKTLQSFSQGSIDVLVCSDSIARGIDIENVRYVISYDKPPFLKTYIHRAGRTARAGRPGTAITFLQNHEVGEFKKMMVTAKGSFISEMTVNSEDLQPMENDYKQALERVATSVADESHKGKLK